MSRERPLVRADSKPHFPPYVRMQFDPIRKRMAVLAPERVYWPDGVAADILKLCDGARTVAAMAEQLAKEYAAPQDTIETDIAEFVQSWTDMRLLMLTAR
jgi:pyrroloquinoline quinone biosynthesis protein D